jgi:dsRNA-specific ribonuclease
LGPAGGEGTSRREADQAAARALLDRLIDESAAA